jgi:hypothetical protein
MPISYRSAPSPLARYWTWCDHLLSELLFVVIAFLLRDLGGVDFHHVARRGLLDEIIRLGRDAKRRVDASLPTK